MNVLVIGANGTTGRKIVQILADSAEHTVTAMVRKEEQMEKMEQLGSKPILADLEENFEFTMKQVNAVVFAAGSGPDTEKDKTTAIDENGAKKSMDYAKKHQIERFILFLSQGSFGIRRAFFF
ncbi:NAD(P)H-binding protein [Bacillus sp. 2205SS5-2]|uniref:NAD(P)H-binding protein n=1 Tax=Bacillus sp. 2205SS5-2 TaxID=3109031 RepID=UPI00300582FD